MADGFGALSGGISELDPYAERLSNRPDAEGTRAQKHRRSLRQIHTGQLVLGANDGCPDSDCCG